MKRNIAFGAVLCILLACYGCEREVSFTENEEPVYNYFQLEVTSNPQGAKIYFGDKATGYVTPCTMKFVESGSYNLKLKLDLFRDASLGVNGYSGNKVVVNYNYFSDYRNYGTISCSTTPGGAKIFLNGNDTGFKTPANISSLWPGKYKISYTLNNYRRDSIETTVKAGSISQAVVPLNDTTVYVDYTRETGSFYGSAVYADKKGRIWYGTVYNGLYVYENRRFENYTYHNSPLPTNSINMIFEDSRGNVWVGTTGGLARISPEKEWNVFTNQNTPMPISQISGICEDKENNIWITCGKALLKFSSGEWTIYSYGNSSLPNNEITSVGCSTDNSIWVAVNNYGVYRLLNGAWTEFTSANSGIASRYLNAIRTGDNNTVYALATDAVYKFSNGVWSRVNAGYSSSINGSYIDPAGTLWIGHFYSFMCIRPDGKWDSFNINSVPNVSNISSRGFAKDNEKNIWIATYKLGLVKFKYGK